MKCVILAAGTGSRFSPVTNGISKHLIPVYDKPMIFFPISMAMLADIKEIAIVINENDVQNYHRLLGDGRDIGLKIEYIFQEFAAGIAHGLGICEDFVNGDDVLLILGDNLFYGNGLTDKLKNSSRDLRGACIWTHKVRRPEAYGVVQYNSDGTINRIIEKPEIAPSNDAVCGVYFYKSDVFDKIKNLKISSRGEYEITDLNNAFIEDGTLDRINLDRGFAWLDTGTPDNMLEASNFIRAIQEKQGYQIGNIHEIAYAKRWLKKDDAITVCAEKKADYYQDFLLRISQ